MARPRNAVRSIPHDAADRWTILHSCAKNFASTDSGRPLFQGIMCQPTNNRAFVTNTHHLLLVNNCHDHTEPVTKHFKTGAPIPGTQPNVDNLLNPSEKKPYSSGTLLGPWLPDWIAGLKAAIAAGKMSGRKKDDPFVSVVLELCGRDKNHINLTYTHQGDSSELTLSNKLSLQDAKGKWDTAFNAPYLLSIFEAFDAFGADTVNLVQYAGPNSPLIFTAEDAQVQAIVTPIRRETVPARRPAASQQESKEESCDGAAS